MSLLNVSKAIPDTRFLGLVTAFLLKKKKDWGASKGLPLGDMHVPILIKDENIFLGLVVPHIT
ncbi:hypothetical protein NQ317_001159 [Molorchus minor]|uniref:Uncharacterized protein n=1 Tax=Molorchus minor TaxID=1323400 RepID=A0ABQ9JXG3_9CUCU|nr:hypothetical protein NQ317_001159 [Molorchus minor]